ncbi:M1 family aminopeptidase [Aquimarina sp. 2201CG14-23]|uniref:M1 family aminopeptidase n=1 Tax=Aquimarina mycalae TaxID=3040073 RepID=UPI0024781A22|nr:M1 family aminopeptidase [Aquimarina sp. 2201CG14-23]MDH7446673.1 M1 family aminopeptidase [Aquimarina sp. 2201CG14-23]
MRNIVILGLVFVALLSCNRTDIKTISYRISPITKDSLSMLKVNMSFEADSGGITKLSFQNEAWGEKDIYNCIKDMQLLNEKGNVTVNKDSGWVIIEHPKEVRLLDFEYTLKQDRKGLSSKTRYRPIINETYFHIFSHNMFMLPSYLGPNPDDVLNIELRWEDFPDDYVIHNSFGSQKKYQLIENIEKEEFHTAIFVGGDFRTFKNNVKNNEVILATRGKWVSYADKDISNLLKTTIEAQRDFWQDHTQKYFTVTMLPFFQERGSGFGGTGLTNSFATTVSNNKNTSIDQMVYLFNHELMHNWIGNTIQNENEEEQYWFSEGFTEYYTFKNIATHKINNLDANYFVDEVNRTIRDLFTSPVASSPNSEITYDNYWSDRHYGKLPYYRGAVYAFILDLKIQKDSNGKHSLDNIMQDIFKSSIDQNQKVNSAFFRKVVNKYLKEDISSFHKTHIIDGELIELDKMFNQFGLEYIPDTDVFDLGFKENSETYKVLAVDSTSNAYKAGLREGDQIVWRSIYYGRVDKQVDLNIIRNKDEKIDISYLPVKRALIPQLKRGIHNRDRLFNPNDDDKVHFLE